MNGHTCTSQAIVLACFWLLGACGDSSETKTTTIVTGSDAATGGPLGTSGAEAGEAGGTGGGATGSSGSAPTSFGGSSGRGTGHAGGDTGGNPGVPFAELSDEFDDAATLQGWTLRHQAEGEDAQYSVLDIDQTVAGHLTIVPTTSGWFRDFDGPFMFKLVEGDFVVEAWVQAGRQGDPDSPPQESFNSAGILVRDPEHGPGHENWLVHNVGRQSPEVVGTENKNTVDSDSQLFLYDGAHRGRLRICRVGTTFILLRQLEGENEFSETRRFQRTDLPEVVQVGPMANGWNSGGGEPDYTRTPDVEARFDYIRFWQPSDESSCWEQG